MCHSRRQEIENQSCSKRSPPDLPVGEEKKFLKGRVTFLLFINRRYATCSSRWDEKNLSDLTGVKKIMNGDNLQT